MIPKIVHQTWRSSELPVLFRKIQTHNTEKMSNFEFKLWSHSPGAPDIDIFIEKEYPELYEIYKKTKYGVQKADIARLAILHKFGGVYFDLDILCLKNIDNLIDLESDYMFIAMEPSIQTKSIFNKENMLCNAFIAIPANHSITKTALGKIVEIYKQNGDSIFNTFNCFGSDIVTSSIMTDDNFEKCKFVKRDLLYPISDPKLQSLPTCKSDIEKLKIGNYDDSFMVHYWIHSDFESKEKIENFIYDSSCDIHMNVYRFFQNLYTDNEYLKN